jgi:hypothetical protein
MSIGFCFNLTEEQDTNWNHYKVIMVEDHALGADEVLVQVAVTVLNRADTV